MSDIKSCEPLEREASCLILGLLRLSRIVAVRLQIQSFHTTHKRPVVVCLKLSNAGVMQFITANRRLQHILAQLLRSRPNVKP